jgi:hypothetical protein
MCPLGTKIMSAKLDFWVTFGDVVASRHLCLPLMTISCNVNISIEQQVFCVLEHAALINNTNTEYSLI